MSYHRSTYSTFSRAYGGRQQNYAEQNYANYAEQFNYEEQLRIREEQIRITEEERQNYEQRLISAEEERRIR